MNSKYFNVNNYSQNGSLFLSAQIFKEIAANVLFKNESVFPVSGSKTEKLFEDYIDCVSVSFTKEEIIDIKIKINILKTANIKETCIEIQKSISAIIIGFLETKTFNINIKIEKIV